MTSEVSGTRESRAEESTVIGVLGSDWRAHVDGWGNVVPFDSGEPTWKWAVAADDRWHEGDGTVRRRCIDGTPVIETRVRVPSGDVVQTVWAATDRSGRPVVAMRFDNESSLPVVVSSSRTDAVSSRPVAARVDVPAGATDSRDRLLVPVGHRSSCRLVVAAGWNGSPDETAVPDAESVARGWIAITERAGRVVLPDTTGGVPIIDDVASARVDSLLAGVDDGDAVMRLLRADQRHRMGVDAPDPTDVASWVEEILRGRRRWWRSERTRPGARLALLAAERLLVDPTARTDLRRAVANWRGGSADDVASAWGVVSFRGEADHVIGSDESVAVLRLAALEDRLVRDGGNGRIVLLPDGFAPTWLGQSIEVHGVAVGADRRFSFAVRWHGARPAVLWEHEGSREVLVTSGVDPDWSSTEPTGESLWRAPAPAAVDRDDDVVVVVTVAAAGSGEVSDSGSVSFD